MNSLKRLSGFMCATLLMLSAACSGSDKASLQPIAAAAGGSPSESMALPLSAPGQAGGAGLPAPVELIEASPRGASYVPADLREEAESFSALLPSNRVSPTASGAVFSPSWSTGDQFSDLAYASYHFEIEGYDLNPQLKFGWTTAPAQGHLWVALSDWDNNRWQWFRPASDSLSLSLASLDPFIGFGGDMVVVVMLTGTTPYELDWLRAGSELPVAALTVTGPRSGWGSLDTAFDASASSDPDGTIVKFDWDWNHDGSFDNTTGTNPVAEHSFNEPGTHVVTVRVRDNNGVEAMAEASVSVGADWSHTYGTGGYDHFSGVAAAPDGSIWAAGYIYDPGGEGPSNECLLVHFGANGELLDEIFWAGSSAQTSTQYFLGIAIDASDGSIYTAGHVADSSPMRSMFQRWSPAGEIEYCKELPGDALHFARLRLGGPYLLLSGNRIEPPLNFQAYVHLINKDGTLESQYLSAPSVAIADAIYRSSIAVLNPPAVLLCGEQIIHDILDPMITQTDAMYYSIPLDGSAAAGRRYGAPTANEKAVSVSLISKLAGSSVPMVVMNAPDAGGTLYTSFCNPFVEGLIGYSFGITPQPDKLHGFSGGHYCSAYDTAPLLLTVNNNFTLEGAHRLSGISVIMNDSATGIAGSAAICGTTLDANAGSYVDAGTPFSVPLAGSWSDIGPGLFTAAAGELTDRPATNHSLRTPGTAVLDSGGGQQDAWIHVFKPE